MESLITLPSLAIVVFVSTNIDDVFVLLGFFADRKFPARSVVIGQYAGIATLYGVSVVASLISLVIPGIYIGLLGIAPIVIGGKKLLDLVCDRKETEDPLEHWPETRGRILTVAMVTIANGGDNIGTYTPLFAIRSGNEIALIGLVFAMMTAV
jgi:cadmium resistance protein CadD (predicted permease)